jgi:dihydrofolate reductase
MAIIVAVDEAGGFGKDGKIPWHNKEDFAHFKEITKDSPCVMGRRTYQDMLDMKKDKDNITEILPGRDSFVVTRNADFEAPGATIASNLRQAVQQLDIDDRRTVFVLGGEKLFIEALAWVDTIYMTIMDGHYDCDRFFPISALKKFDIAEGKQGDGLKFVTYKRRR